MDRVVQMPDRLAGAGKAPNGAADKLSGAASKASGELLQMPERANTSSSHSTQTGESTFADLQERIGMGRAVAVDGYTFCEIRAALGFSQRDVERVSGVGRSSISEFETEGYTTEEQQRALLLALRRMAYERQRDTLLALAVMEKAVNG